MFADEKGWFAVRNEKTGYIWYSHPNNSLADTKTVGINKQNFQSEVIVSYLYKDEEGDTSSYTEASINSQSAVRSGWVKTEKIKNGIKITYDFYTISARVCVSYTIEGDTLKAKIIGKETLERGDFRKAVNKTATKEQLEVMQDSYITSIWLLPTFGAGSETDKGFVFVPDGCGAYINYAAASHPTEIANIPVYGAELSIDEYGVKKEAFSSITRGAAAYIPVFALAREEDGVLATITSGEAVASINAFKAGSTNAYTGVSAQIDLRKVTYTTIGTRRVQGVSSVFDGFPDFEVCYKFLSGKDVSFAGFAGVLRADFERQGKLKKQSFTPSLSIQTVGAIDVAAHFLGLPSRKIKPLTTFGQAGEILSELKGEGINNVAVNYLGWTNNGLQNSKAIKNAAALKVLGGSKGLKAFAAGCDTLYLDTDLLTFKKSGNGVFKNKDAAKTAFDKTALIRNFSYSTFTYESTGLRLLTPQKLEKVFSKYIKSAKKLPKNAGQSFNSLSDSCYSNLGSRNPYSRIKTVELYEKMLSGVKRSMSAENANSYMFRYVSRIYDAPDCSSRQKIYDGEVPFYQMLVHGFIAVTSPALNQCSVRRSAFLRAVETGSELMFLVMYEDSGIVNGTDYNYLYGSTFGMLKEEIRLCLKI